MTVYTHTALKKLRKSLEEWKEIITLPQRWFGGEFALMAPQSRIPLQLKRPSQVSSGWKRTFHQEALILTH
ncbi:unnamed protein product [Nezara viridula]|uniref:Uncharacterized protein n=1 Tax=Nezara viridula TaxID=85310 RepID=A0A9P0HL71_NEZVI|nr:unnamed protein product [Nezara viridula]